jgi:hypothetical protein
MVHLPFLGAVIVEGDNSFTNPKILLLVKKVCCDIEKSAKRVEDS